MYGRPEVAVTSRQQIIRSTHTKLQLLVQEQSSRLFKVYFLNRILQEDRVHVVLSNLPFP